MKYKEANWDQIKKDLENTLTTINNIYEKNDTNILWSVVLFVLYVSVFYTLKDFGFSSCGICSFYL
jgi:hypothetical protein